MKYEFQYTSNAERNNLLQENSDKFLIEEKILFVGNFLIFTDVKPQEVILSELTQKMKSNELQINALDGKSELLEGALVELTSMVLE